MSTTMRLDRDAAATVLAGLGAAWVMNRVTTAFYARQSTASRRRERKASSDVAYAVVMKKAAERVGMRLEHGTAERLGTAFHYTVGAALAPGYVFLRRRLGIPPVQAGVVLGLSVSVVVDEVANPVLGFSAPPQAYPLATHLRGLAGHLAYGLAVTVLFEGATKAIGALHHTGTDRPDTGHPAPSGRGTADPDVRVVPDELQQATEHGNADEPAPDNQATRAKPAR